MTVPRGLRAQSKLEVIVQARKLCGHTLVCTSNKNIFIPGLCDPLVQKINEAAELVYINCWRANSIRTDKTDEERKRRRELQAEALWRCEELLAWLALAKDVFHFRARKLEYWAELVEKCENLIKGWMK